MLSARSISQDVCLPAVTRFQKLEEVGNALMRIGQGEGDRVGIASRGQRDGDDVVLHFHARRPIGQQYAHTPSLSPVFRFCSRYSWGILGLASRIAFLYYSELTNATNTYENGNDSVPQSLPLRRDIPNTQICDPHTDGVSAGPSCANRQASPPSPAPSPTLLKACSYSITARDFFASPIRTQPVRVAA